MDDAFGENAISLESCLGADAVTLNMAHIAPQHGVGCGN